MDLPRAGAREDADAMVNLIATLRGIGRVEPAPAVPEVLGKPGRTFREFAQRHAAALR